MNLQTSTIRDIALENPATTRVFEEFKIDYCCGGRKSLEEACAASGVDPAMLAARINEVLEGPRQSGDAPEELPLDKLIDHIVEKHHVFTRNEIGRLTLLFEKVCHKHGGAHPELIELRALFDALREDLTTHMRKEELVLFPYIKEAAFAHANGSRSLRMPPFGTVQNPVRVMMAEHDVAGDILRQMRKASADFAAPDDACPSFRALYHGAEELEHDLHQHIHLENNVLFPKAVDLECKLLQP